MQISEENKKAIADEFNVIANLMDKENDVLRKVFYFSGAYGVVYRVLNAEYNNELALIHGVLNNTYAALDGRCKSIVSGAERVISWQDNTFNVLSLALKELGDAIIGENDLYKSLATIATIGYTTTGNGYYLSCKGSIKLE